MRDQEAYTAQGRSDPYDAQQMREHPYDFVSLPDRPARGEAVPHDRFPADRFTGVLSLEYRLESPLHVGSGVFERADECGLGGGDTPVRGIMRRQRAPVLPGSGWKGAVRSRFEAITGSRLGLVDTESRQKGFKVPEVLKSGPHDHKVIIRDRRVQELQPLREVKSAKDLDKLSPAEALFGCLGYRGRIHPTDGRISASRPTQPLRIAPMESPVMHRLGKPGEVHKTAQGIEIRKVEGRKFYYDGPIVSSRTMETRSGPRETYELIDYVPEGANIAIDVSVEAVSAAELGALLVSAGFGERVGILRFGGFKSVGLGAVRLVQAVGRMRRGADSRRWKQPAAEPISLEQAVEEAFKSLVSGDALAELHEITTRRRG
jgi:CRISPR/Cas system CSM-associated protein Csm3 (group 7 of RAMP superfamily)